MPPPRRLVPLPDVFFQRDRHVRDVLVCLTGPVLASSAHFVLASLESPQDSNDGPPTPFRGGPNEVQFPVR